jgi:Uma2 family endonuclease
MRAPLHRYTWEQYLALEGDSALKHEFWSGEIYLMAGGTADHALLTANAIVALGSQLKGQPCRAYSADLRIRVQSSGLATYPDVCIICGEVEYESTDKKRTTVVNPTVLVEVLSDSTEDYDRTIRFEHYQRIPTLQEYVLVSQREELIEVFRRGRGEAGWERFEARTGSSVRLESIHCELRTADLYAGRSPPSR